MKDERKTILWLVSWYPNKYDVFEGDFIQRHAKAAALFNDIHVLFVKQAAEQDREEEVLHQESGLTEQIIYLPKKEGLIGRLWCLRRWQKVSRTAAAAIIMSKKPPVVHVHVPWKAGLLALWVKKKYAIDYFVTEHWGIYNSVVKDNIHTHSFLFRRLLKKVYLEARSFASVSRFLAEGVNKTLVKKSFTVIPNVVDTNQFNLVAKKASIFTFLHVSNMVPLKNVEGILVAFKQFLLQTGAQARLILVGNRDIQYVQLASEIGLSDTVVSFKGEISYSEVAKEMRQAHVFVLNSDMENSPCVIGEALCCGLPVIATQVGGIPELVSEENSILLQPRDNNALSAAFEHMYSHYPSFKPREIAYTAQQTFSYRAVGQRLYNIYKA